MLTSAKIHICNRPMIRSYDARGHPISFSVIPTLEDMRDLLFEPGDLAQNIENRVATMQDIDLAACLAGAPQQVIRKVPYVGSNIAIMVSIIIHNPMNECIHSGGTTEIFDSDGSTELSLDSLSEKYFREVEVTQNPFSS
jgi:hypothetical protein